MEELKRDIEQLYEAGRQLKKLTPTGARLALFLMDNLAELFMYRTALDHFQWDKTWHKPPKYSSSKRDKVMKYFNEKVNFLTNETKDVTQTECNVMKLGHRLRNEAYHKGVLRDSIIVVVASVYFEVVCDLHPRLWVGHYTLPPDKDEIPSFLRKHGLEVKNSLIDPALLARLSNLFLEGSRCTLSEVSEVLSTDLEGRLEEALGRLEYLAEKPRTAEDVLKHMQFYDKFWNEHSFPQTNDGARQYFESWKREYEEYSPPIKTEHLRRWKQRATALKSRNDLGSVVQKFNQLDQAFLPIEEKIIEAMVAYDMHINQEVTRMKEESV